MSFTDNIRTHSLQIGHLRIPFRILYMPPSVSFSRNHYPSRLSKHSLQHDFRVGLCLNIGEFLARVYERLCFLGGRIPENVETSNEQCGAMTPGTSGRRTCLGTRKFPDSAGSGI